jgi:hypothetical protein
MTDAAPDVVARFEFSLKEARQKMTMTDTPLLMGLRIRFERSKDVPCTACGQRVVVIGKSGSLHCATCDRHRGWLPKTIADFLLETISRFGRPPKAITIRNPEFAQANATAPLGAPAAATSAP